MLLRICKIILIFNIALLFTAIVINNVTDYHTGLILTQHVLSMDSIFPDTPIKSRAIHDMGLQQTAFIIIVLWEAMVALILWYATIQLLVNLRHPQLFNNKKKIAIFGLTLGFILYSLGFAVVANEWFVMWQSKTWNVSVISYFTLIGLVLIIFQQENT